MKKGSQSCTSLGAVCQEEGTSAADPHYQKLVWPEEVKKSSSVVGEKLGAEKRGGRKAGREAEAWERVIYCFSVTALPLYPVSSNECI